MLGLMICALLLAALCTASIILFTAQEHKLQPEPIRIRHNRIRRR